MIHKPASIDLSIKQVVCLSDTQTYPVMGNHESYGLALQASAEYGQADDETFRAALQNGLLAKM